MARIVIASRSEESRDRLAGLLTSSGYQVFRSCGSGSELRRALSESEDCVVVMAGLLQDCHPDELLMVDDLKPGLEMAHACGVDFAACFWSYDIPVIRNYMKENADFCLNSVTELSALIFGEDA